MSVATANGIPNEWADLRTHATDSHAAAISFVLGAKRDRRTFRVRLAPLVRFAHSFVTNADAVCRGLACIAIGFFVATANRKINVRTGTGPRSTMSRAAAFTKRPCTEFSVVAFRIGFARRLARTVWFKRSRHVAQNACCIAQVDVAIAVHVADRTTGEVHVKPHRRITTDVDDVRHTIVVGIHDAGGSEPNTANPNQ